MFSNRVLVERWERLQKEQAVRTEAFDPDLPHLNSGADDILRREPDWVRIEDDLRAMYARASGTRARLSVFTLGRRDTTEKKNIVWTVP